MAFYFPDAIKLKKILNQSWFRNIIDLILWQLEEAELMIVVTSPWEHHLFGLVDAALVRRVSWVARSSKELIIHRCSTASKRSLPSTSELVLPIHCSSSTVSQSSDHKVMVGSTLNICHFGVEQSEDHRRWADIIRAFLVWNWFSSIIIKHIELWCILLFPAELSKIISSHGIYKTTWGK